MKEKTHRVVKIATGEVSEVSEMVASDRGMLLEYGYMLQELDEDDSSYEEDLTESKHILIKNPSTDEVITFVLGEEVDGIYSFSPLDPDHIAFPVDFDFQAEIKSQLELAEKPKVEPKPKSPKKVTTKKVK